MLATFTYFAFQGQSELLAISTNIASVVFHEIRYVHTLDISSVIELLSKAFPEIKNAMDHSWNTARLRIYMLMPPAPTALKHLVTLFYKRNPSQFKPYAEGKYAPVKPCKVCLACRKRRPLRHRPCLTSLQQPARHLSTNLLRDH